jgi:hypothetical protein
MSEQQGSYKTRKQTIFRTIKNEDNPFVMIDRRPIENPTLTWKAKGILAYLLSRPDNWIVRLGDLVKRSPDGVYSIRGAINELQKAGHVHRKEVREENGRFVRYELEVYELPFTPDPLINFPQADNPQAGNLMLNDTDINENELSMGADAPDLSNLPLEWQVASGVSKVVNPDNVQAKRVDAANLIAMGFGSNTRDAYDLAMAFQNERGITFTESDIKPQRKAIKTLLEKKVTPEHVKEATRSLMERLMTVTDLYSVIRTATDLANKVVKPQEMTRLL